MAVAFLAVASLATAGAFKCVVGNCDHIYPPGHFDSVTKIASSSFESFVKEKVDSGQTLFVRWVASHGEGAGVEQAPAWNRITKAFANHTDVAFGECNLSDELEIDGRGFRGKYAGKPGTGGWPTIRAYNKKTGYEGAFAGDWKDANELEGTNSEVFGQVETLERYVLELASTSLCRTNTGAGCSHRELAFIGKFTREGSGPTGQVAALQLARLQGMEGMSMKPELKEWLGQRIAILKQLSMKDEL